MHPFNHHPDFLRHDHRPRHHRRDHQVSHVPQQGRTEGGARGSKLKTWAARRIFRRSAIANRATRFGEPDRVSGEWADCICGR